MRTAPKCSWRAVNQVVEISAEPLFQYLAFYSKNDLEMLPGANTVFSGKVFSNKDMYLGVQPGNTFRLNSSFVQSAGKINRNRKDNTSDMMEGQRAGAEKRAIAWTHGPLRQRD